MWSAEATPSVRALLLLRRAWLYGNARLSERSAVPGGCCGPVGSVVRPPLRLLAYAGAWSSGWTRNRLCSMRGSMREWRCTACTACHPQPRLSARQCPFLLQQWGGWCGSGYTGGTGGRITKLSDRRWSGTGWSMRSEACTGSASAQQTKPQQPHASHLTKPRQSPMASSKASGARVAWRRMGRGATLHSNGCC